MISVGRKYSAPIKLHNLEGIKCTPGLIGRSDFCRLIEVQDTPGPVARTVLDCALMPDSMVGFDPKDGFTSKILFAGPPEGESYASNLDLRRLNRPG
jgi:amidase